MKKRSGDSSRLGDVGEMLMQKPPLGTPLDWENPLNDGTVLHLAMNEGHGDKVQDLSLNGNHGTLHNFVSPPTATSGWNPGRTGVGLNFDGTGAYIDCGVNNGSNVTGPFMLSALVNITAFAGDNRRVIGKGSDYYGLAIAIDGKVRFNIRNAANTIQVAYSTDALELNTDYHILGRFDGQNLRVFVDGNDVSAAATTQTDIKDSSAIPLEIGRRPVSGDDWFCGGIDQPRVQTGIWSAKEVRDYSINPWQVYLQP